uniref:Synaptotagmin-like protein 2 n=2 Tax=Knipowitschia caucasica TaxID=637954 RepID=A0AAV2JBW5_KNICA
MIDLSFLTEEEQEVILGVLKRDADLKRAEEQRVQKLQQIICDRARLKYLTGEWFYETKQLRHQERIHGSDIIWASMKHTHKPMTILELSQIVPNRPSFVSGENKEVFVPAVLCGLLQEPTPGPCNTWKDDPNPYETGPIKPMSPTKRKNPFNNQAVEDVFTELRDRPTLPQLPSENNEHISDHVNPYGPFQNQDPSSPLFLISQKSALKPVPEENNEEMEDAVDTSNCVVSRGILKFLANTAMLEAQGTVRAESPVDSWADQKPVRVSSALSESGGRIQDGKELGEHSLLDVDTPTEWTVSGQDSTHAKDKAREPECKSTNWKVAVQEGSQETNDGPEWCEAQSPKPPAPSATLETGDPACVESEDGHVPPPSDKQITSESSKKNLSTGICEPDRGEITIARSVIPQDYQHYLGPREQAHLPPFEEASAVDVLRRPQSPMGEFVENQNKDPRVSSWIEQIRESGDDTRAWSLSRASAGSYEEGSGPVMSALKRLSTKMSSSKSLENLTSPTREEKEQLNKSVDDVSEFPSTTFSTTKKSSVSVPAFQLDETDSDSPLENNLSYRRNTGSSASNISLSSGMASMSSVGGSMTSIYHNDLGDVDVQGTIQFAVNYIQKLGEFHIFVVHCRDLAVGDSKKSRSDPYVKCYLVPDKTKLGKRKTSIKKKTVNPTYNEILRFKILLEVLKFQHLNVSVWHNDTFGRNSFLGEVDLDLSQWDFSNAQISEYSLKARASSAALTSTPSPTRTTDSSRGQMRVAVRFLPQTSPSKRTSRNETGEVQIWVKDCKNLPPIRGVIIDPFVKCTVLPDTSRKSRQKTRVVKRTANPMFNHTMVYDGFRSEDLKEACVELTVWDHDRLNNHYIGGVRLGLGTGKSYGVDVNWMDSTTSEASLWQRMLDSAGEWLEDVLPLRMLLMAKSMSN